MALSADVRLMAWQVPVAHVGVGAWVMLLALKQDLLVMNCLGVFVLIRCEFCIVEVHSKVGLLLAVLLFLLWVMLMIWVVVVGILMHLFMFLNLRLMMWLIQRDIVMELLLLFVCGYALELTMIETMLIATSIAAVAVTRIPFVRIVHGRRRLRIDVILAPHMTVVFLSTDVEVLISRLSFLTFTDGVSWRRHAHNR